MGVFDRLFGRGKPQGVEQAVDVQLAAPQRAAPADAGARASRPSRADEPGSFRGKHFTEWAPIVDQLRVEGRLDESLALAYECIEATEREDGAEGYGVAPAYYEDAAIVLRKQRRYAEEVQVLERYLQRTKGRHPKLEDRRRKAVALRDTQLNATPPACASCGTLLEAPPKSRGKCPSCAQTLVMRTVNGQRVAFTPEQAEAHTIADKAAKQRSAFLLRLGYYDVTDQDWDRVHAEQAERFGFPSADGDVYWQLANEAAVAYERAQDWAAAARVRQDMAKFCVEEGREWLPSAQLCEQSSLRVLQQYDRPDAAMILIACDCDPCQRDHQLSRTLGEFAASWPLPHADCDRPPCKCRITRCLY